LKIKYFNHLAVELIWDDRLPENRKHENQIMKKLKTQPTDKKIKI
jgi:hypothetical protein